MQNIYRERLPLYMYVSFTFLQQKSTPHRFPFHHIVPEHDDEGGPDLRQHVMQAEFFHKQPHADLVDPQPHDAGTDEQRRLAAGLFPRAGKYKFHAEPVINNDRNRKGNGRGVQVVDAQTLGTKIEQGVIHHKGRAADDGEAKNFRKTVVFHTITKKLFFISVNRKEALIDSSARLSVLSLF